MACVDLEIFHPYLKEVGVKVWHRRAEAQSISLALTVPAPTQGGDNLENTDLTKSKSI